MFARDGVASRYPAWPRYVHHKTDVTLMAGHAVCDTSHTACSLGRDGGYLRSYFPFHKAARLKAAVRKHSRFFKKILSATYCINCISPAGVEYLGTSSYCLGNCSS